MREVEIILANYEKYLTVFIGRPLTAIFSKKSISTEHSINIWR